MVIFWNFFNNSATQILSKVPISATAKNDQREEITVSNIDRVMELINT